MTIDLLNLIISLSKCQASQYFLQRILGVVVLYVCILSYLINFVRSVHDIFLNPFVKIFSFINLFCSLKKKEKTFRYKHLQDRETKFFKQMWFEAL